jgi:hypothetical protein
VVNALVSASVSAPPASPSVVLLTVARRVETTLGGSDERL